MSYPQRACEGALRSGRLLSDDDLRDLWRLPAQAPLPDSDQVMVQGLYVATPLPQADGRRRWRLCRGIRTPANPNASTSRVMTLPLPSMRCLDGVQELIQAPVFVKDAFAPDDILTDTLAALTDREADFSDSETTDPAMAGLRRSRILAGASGLEDSWRAWIRHETKWAMDALGMNERVADLEVQLTAHGDGGYYRTHRDVSDGGDVETRILTFVYYLSRRPRPFAGGQLKLYDYRCVDGIWRQADTFQLVEPEPNRLVLFPACFLHEVLPVQRFSGAFADSRFTVNGWVHRAEW